MMKQWYEHVYRGSFDVEFIFGVRLSLSTLKCVFFGQKSMDHYLFSFDGEWIRDGCAVAKLTCGVRKRDVMFGAFSSPAFESHICCRFAHCRKNKCCQAGAKKKRKKSSASHETKPHFRTWSQSLGQKRGALEVKNASSWNKKEGRNFLPERLLWESIVDCRSELSMLVRRVTVSTGTWKLKMRTPWSRKTLRPSSLLRALSQGL